MRRWGIGVEELLDLGGVWGTGRAIGKSEHVGGVGDLGRNKDIGSIWSFGLGLIEFSLPGSNLVEFHLPDDCNECGHIAGGERDESLAAD